MLAIIALCPLNLILPRLAIAHTVQQPAPGWREVP